MKRKLKGVLGIGLTLVLLASLTVGLAVPAAADPGTLKFTKLPLPRVDALGDYWAYPDSDVGAIDVAADGDTMFAALDDGTNWQLMKSTDGGYAWKVTGFTGDSTAIVDVVVSPDYEEDLTVFVATEDYVYQSVDGGKRFVCMDDTPIWAATTIKDLDVALDERGRLAYMVGTSAGVLPAVLQTWGQTTAEWVTAPAAPTGYSGSYSVKFTQPTVADWDDMGAAKVFYGQALDSISFGDIFFTYYADDVHYPYPSLWLDTGGGNVVDKVLVGNIVATQEIDAWTDTALALNDWWKWCTYDPDTGELGPQEQEGKTLAGWQAEYPGATLVWVALGYGGPGSEHVLYVDDFTIKGVTYQLEPGGDVYVLSTATGMSWQPQEIGDYNVLAVGFSPFFADDEGISAVVTSSVSTKVRFSFACVGEENPGLGWDKDIGDAGIYDALGHPFPSTHARIAFPDDFDAFGVDNNVCFVGIYAGSETDPDNMLGDVYKLTLGSSSSATDLDIRGVITTLLPTATNIFSIDVCGDAEEANILVGTDFCSLQTAGYYFLVYRSDDAGETWIPSGTKSPTGGDAVGTPLPTLVFTDARTQVLMSPDFLTDEIAYAATSGVDTSALSRTKDSGAVWDQISLIDYDEYAVTSLAAAGYNADDTLHMTTSAGSAGAVWKRTNGGKNWERIWSYANPGVTPAIGKVIVNGDETIFAVDWSACKIWRSSDMGATWPKKITTKPELSCVTIVSPTTIYTGHTDGNIYWSTKSGTAWTKPEDSEIPADTEIPNIEVAGDVVLISSFAGKVFISSDGGETVERVGITNPGGATDAAAATFDLGFADNNIIYAAIAGTEDGGIWRTEVDFDDPGAAEWLRIDDLQATVPYDYTKVIPWIPALALPPEGVLYVVNKEAVITEDADEDGGLWRCTNPTDPAPYPYFEKENKGLDEGDSLYLLGLDLFPTVLFCRNDSTAEGIEYYDRVVMFTDTLDSGVPLTAPADGAAGVGTLYEGQWEADVVLAWAEMEGATRYEYQIAIDDEFLSVLPDSGFTKGKVASLDLSPNTTYYWRVRVAYETTVTVTDDTPTVYTGLLIGAPLISPWSEARSFKTVIGPTVARPALEAPDAGEVDVLLSPTFEWSGIEWAERYEFELATGPGTTAGGYFTDVLVGLTGADALVSTAWKCDIALDYEARYYWHVKAIGVDTETPWSDVGTFTTMGVAPAPPEPAPPLVIPPVEEITPMWLWVIIGIGAALMIAVIILIVTTRRVP